MFGFISGLSFLLHWSMYQSLCRNHTGGFGLVWFFLFQEPHPQHVDVPRLGSSWSCSSQPTPQPQQLGVWAMSVVYTAACGSAGFLTYRARPGIEPPSSWILVRFVTPEPRRELHKPHCCDYRRFVGITEIGKRGSSDFFISTLSWLFKALYAAFWIWGLALPLLRSGLLEPWQRLYWTCRRLWRWRRRHGMKSPCPGTKHVLPRTRNSMLRISEFFLLEFVELLVQVFIFFFCLFFLILITQCGVLDGIPHFSLSCSVFHSFFLLIRLGYFSYPVKFTDHFWCLVRSVEQIWFSNLSYELFTSGISVWFVCIISLYWLLYCS